ncbi:hypothetical protein HDU76_003664 [Blyttiomyces sp. JEL0837]|nr:hypothetical protein HDU76_003664 [Blyttiomyces sp. JEL0837]
MVTQSNIVEFILLNLDRLHPKPDATLLELGFFGTSPVLYCDENEVVIEVFATMNRAPISALPMRSQSAVTGILTVRDIKLLTSENLRDLLLPVRDFLKKHRPTFILGNVQMTLRDLLRSMVINSFHHLFFVNESGVPTHVITLTDILDFVIPPESMVVGSVVNNVGNGAGGGSVTPTPAGGNGSTTGGVGGLSR